MLNLLTIVCALGLTVWRAYAVGVVWGWFVVPAFGIPVPGLWTIAGLVLLVALVRGSGKDEESIWHTRRYEAANDSDRRTVDRLAAVLGQAVSVLLMLAVGWVYLKLQGA